MLRHVLLLKLVKVLSIYIFIQLLQSVKVHVTDLLPTQLLSLKDRLHY